VKGIKPAFIVVPKGRMMPGSEPKLVELIDKVTAKKKAAA